MEENYIDKVKRGSESFDFKDTTSGYITTDVDDLTNYMNNDDLEEALDEKADVSDIPVAGQIASGNTGYATGGQIYDALNGIESRLAAL